MKIKERLRASACIYWRRGWNSRGHLRRWVEEQGRFWADSVEVAWWTCWKGVPTLSLKEAQWAAEQGAAVDACDTPSVVDLQWAEDWHPPASTQCALQEHQPQSLWICVNLHTRLVQNIREGARVTCICTTLAAGTRDSEGSTMVQMKAVSGWLAEGRRGRVAAWYGELVFQCKKLHFVLWRDSCWNTM